jgi:adenylate cyclase
MRKEYDKAIAENKTAISLNPNNADAYWTLGWALIFSDRPDEAIGVIKKAIRLNPIPPVVYLSCLALAYRVSKQYEKAIELWKTCVKRQPDFFARIFRISVILSFVWA